MTIVHKLTAACILLAATAIVPACTVPQTASSLTPVAADALNAASPSTVTKLSASCPAIIQGIAMARAGAVVAGASAAELAKIDSDAAMAKAGCDNITVLAANDAKPASPTNSGDSHAWEMSLLSDAVKVASVVLPMVL